MPSTVVFLHAHPDDEALLTGGTIAQLAAEGHRVVLATATDGCAGLTAASKLGNNTLAALRRDELIASAQLLGVARLVPLGYSDSGLDGRGAPSMASAHSSTAPPFAQVSIDAAAAKVLAIMDEEGADVLVGYDEAGGYGHPDHVQVHRVARRAAALRPEVTLLEATMPREPLARAVRAAHRLGRVVPALRGLDPEAWARANAARADITHRVDVRGSIDAKRAALAVHGSQRSGDEGVRTIEVLLRLPQPVFRRLLGWEWFIGPRSTQVRFHRHPLATLDQG